MRARRMLWGIVAALAVQAAAVAGVTMGTGLSTEADAAKAGKAAAEQARKALGDTAARLVLVFDSYPKGDKAKLLEGVAAVFDKTLIHGCSAEGPITEHGNPKGRSVGVCAIGGDIEVAAACSPTIAKDHKAAGEAIGKALPKMANAKVVLLFGNCHIPSNKPLVEGVQSVRGKRVPIIGGSSGGPSTDAYYQGEVRSDVAVGILLGGDFHLTVAARPGRKDNDEVIRTAVEATKTAKAGLGTKPALGIYFECAGRRRKIQKLSDELDALQDVLGKDLPLIGFYGTGEMGPGQGGVCTGFGYHAVCCLIAD
jgi:hypothetical protein